MSFLIDDPYWTLDQVVAWARSRSLDAVEFARSNGGVALEIKINVEAQKATQQGRDIEAELWKAIGREKPEDAPLSTGGEPPISVTLQDKSGGQTGVTLTHVARDGFPINAYVQSLLQSGKIVAFGHVDGAPLSGEIKKEEWAGLQIVEGKNGRRVVVDDLCREVIRNARIPHDQVVVAFDPPTPAQAQPSATPSKRGRKPSIDWAIVEDEVFRLMDHHGEFSPDDPEWNCQARLEQSTADFLQGRYGDGAPAESTVRERIGLMIDRWRNRKAGN